MSLPKIKVFGISISKIKIKFVGKPQAAVAWHATMIQLCQTFRRTPLPRRLTPTRSASVKSSHVVVTPISLTLSPPTTSSCTATPAHSSAQVVTNPNPNLHTDTDIAWCSTTYTTKSSSKSNAHTGGDAVTATVAATLIPSPIVQHHTSSPLSSLLCHCLSHSHCFCPRLCLCLCLCPARQPTPTLSSHFFFFFIPPSLVSHPSLPRPPHTLFVHSPTHTLSLLFLLLFSFPLFFLPLFFLFSTTPLLRLCPHVVYALPLLSRCCPGPYFITRRLVGVRCA